MPKRAQKPKKNAPPRTRRHLILYCRVHLLSGGLLIRHHAGGHGGAAGRHVSQGAHSQVAVPGGTQGQYKEAVYKQQKRQYIAHVRSVRLHPGQGKRIVGRETAMFRGAKGDAYGLEGVRLGCCEHVAQGHLRPAAA